ncbi:DgyrCDS3598 [Dimorphilus gyrociliatus]|uniref:TBC1 domain family member 4 n=1 Tax=Dimorphilus gyrociliatus TaxID=2664684 RepID=A0A7I8VDN3_9ANNE|nr:DgyrCDS3598 [Dimorphilus gyrociliatus]
METSFANSSKWMTAFTNAIRIVSLSPVFSEQLDEKKNEEERKPLLRRKSSIDDCVLLRKCSTDSELISSYRDRRVIKSNSGSLNDLTEESKPLLLSNSEGIIVYLGDGHCPQCEEIQQDFRHIETAHQDAAEAKRLKLDYDEITPCLKEVTKEWTAMLSFPKDKPIARNILLKAVRDGVPRKLRGDIWQLLVSQNKLQGRSSITDNEIESSWAMNTPYYDLLKELTTHQHSILIDLGRTFPAHPYFSKNLGTGQLALFNILKAYSLLDKEVGYCQGLSFVAGVLLMHMDEEDAFDTFRYLMFNMGFRRQYRPDMMALQSQMYQLSRLLHDMHPDLHEHLEKHQIAPALYAAPWFLTLFASQFPLGFVARVFDLILHEGRDVVLKVAIILLGSHRELIKQCNSLETIVEFLKTTLPEMGIIQMERVFNQTFEMDIARQLHGYEIEFHVLQEELLSRPSKEGDEDNTIDSVERLHQTQAIIKSLKTQNLELLEQLQNANGRIRSLEDELQLVYDSQTKMKNHVRQLELERAALIKLTSEGGRTDLNVSTTITDSPIHNPVSSRIIYESSNLNLNKETNLEKHVQEIVRKKSDVEHPINEIDSSNLPAV